MGETGDVKPQTLYAMLRSRVDEGHSKRVIMEGGGGWRLLVGKGEVQVSSVRGGEGKGRSQGGGLKRGGLPKPWRAAETKQATTLFEDLKSSTRSHYLRE